MTISELKASVCPKLPLATEMEMCPCASVTSVLTPWINRLKCSIHICQQMPFSYFLQFLESQIGPPMLSFHQDNCSVELLGMCLQS